MTEMLNTLTVHVALVIRRRGGRKMVITPEGAPPHVPSAPLRTRADPTLVKALARAFRWKRLLETGRCASVSEIAAAEKIDRGYVGTILRLTLLAPEIIEAVMNGQQAPDLALPRLLQPWPLEWDAQRAVLGSMGADGCGGVATAPAPIGLATRPEEMAATPCPQPASSTAHSANSTR